MWKVVANSPHCEGCGVEIPPSSRRPRKWCSGRCRKRKLYAGTCVDCGAPTNGSNGKEAAPDRCIHCSNVHRTKWTRQTVIEAIWEFERRYEWPPTVADWNPQHAHARGHADRAARFYEDGCYPHVFTVQRLFGSWNAGIRAAGFKARRPGHRSRAYSPAS